jgi:hypothetical protein
MLFWRKTTDDSVVGNQADALKRIKELETENKNLSYAVGEYKKRLEDEYSKASYSIDWKKINAFSIERMWDNGNQKTVIGYMQHDPVVTTEGEGESKVTYKDVVREWTLYCTHDEHQRLVKQFNEYVKGNQ